MSERGDELRAEANKLRDTLQNAGEVDSGDHVEDRLKHRMNVNRLGALIERLCLEAELADLVERVEGFESLIWRNVQDSFWTPFVHSTGEGCPGHASPGGCETHLLTYRLASDAVEVVLASHCGGGYWVPLNDDTGLDEIDSDRVLAWAPLPPAYRGAG